MSQYFIAILAPAEIESQVKEWKQLMFDRFGCKVAMRSPAHITLIPPFSMKADREKDLLDLIEYFWEQRETFEVRLKDFGSFDSRVIFVDVVLTERLSLMKRNLEDLVYKSGFQIRKETRPFHPHVTVANRDPDKEIFNKAWEYFRHIKYDALFEVAGISLMIATPRGWNEVRSQFLSD